MTGTGPIQASFLIRLVKCLIFASLSFWFIIPPGYGVRPTTGSGVSSHPRMWHTVPQQDLVFHPTMGCGVPSHHRIFISNFYLFIMAYHTTSRYSVSFHHRIWHILPPQLMVCIVYESGNATIVHAVYVVLSFSYHFVFLSLHCLLKTVDYSLYFLRLGNLLDLKFIHNTF